MNPPRKTVAVNKMTGEVLRFPSHSEAARAFGTRTVTVRRQCQLKSLGMDRWFFRYEEDYDPCECFEGKMHRPVICVDEYEGRLTWFRTVSEAEYFFDFDGIDVYIHKNVRLFGRYRFAKQKYAHQYRAIMERIENETRRKARQ